MSWVFFGSWVGGALLCAGPALQEPSAPPAIDPAAAVLLEPEATFDHFCAPCHGIARTGTGRYYPTKLTPRPTDLRDETFLEERDAQQLFTAISEGSAKVGGSNGCPPWGQTLAAEDIDLLVSLLRPAEPPAEPAPAQETAATKPPKADEEDEASGTWETLLLGAALLLLAVASVFQWRQKPLARQPAG